MFFCLIEKFGMSEAPVYFFKEIITEDLEILRAEARLKKFFTINGSSSFQAIVFKPNSDVIRAAPRLCMYIRSVKISSVLAAFSKSIP